MIKTLQEHEDSQIGAVSFQWRGMNIYLALTMLGKDESKYLSVTVEGANRVEFTPAKKMATWIISSEA